jgi:opacity protein-like surface antigen
MKLRSLTTLGVALSALMFANAAQAQGLYLKGELGGGFGGAYDGAGTADLEDGWRYGAGLGTHLSPNLRLEGELFRSEADVEGAGVESEATVGMGNLYWDFGDVAGFTPFVGAGAGYGQFEAGAFEDEGFAYQLTAGASAAFTDRLTGELAYKFVQAPDLEFAGTDVDYDSSFVTAGLRYRLGS